MSKSTNEPADQRRSCLRIMLAHEPSDHDIVKARNIPRTSCPRRYCWWWRSLSFDWDIDAADGCTFLVSEKPRGIRGAAYPCSRVDRTSHFDHFEPREPHILEDGFNCRHWLTPDSEEA